MKFQNRDVSVTTHVRKALNKILRAVVCGRHYVSSTVCSHNHMGICHQVPARRDKKSSAAFKAIVGLGVDLNKGRLRARHEARGQG
jgi:hypothetical protein